MKEEAEKQMNEIHSRSQPEPEEETPPEQPPSLPQEESIISSLFRDKDKTLILAIMFLLIGEKDGKPDYSLLLALLYLLL